MHFRLAGIIPLYFGLLLAFSSCRTVELQRASSVRQEVLQPQIALTDEFIQFHEDGIMGLVSHNDTDMQVQLIISEPGLQMRLLVMGLTIWVDSTAGRQQEVGIVFPGSGMVRRPRPEGAERPQARERNAERERPAFDPRPLLEIVRQRNKVFHIGQRAQFIEDSEMASVFLDEEDKLHYRIVLPFDKLGVKEPATARLSVGVVSELPAAGPEQQQQRQPDMGRPGYGYPRQDPGMRQQAMQPINSWVIFTFNQKQEGTPAD